MQDLKFSLLLILVLLVSTCSFGQKQSSVNNQIDTSNQTETIQVPKGWKLIDLDSFSFLLPESLIDQKAKGKDSEIWRFESDEIDFYIDSGRYKISFDYDLERFENETKLINKDNIKGQFFKIDFTKPKSPENIKELSKEEKQKPFLTAIVFYRGERFYSSFMVHYQKNEQSEIAEKILNSINLNKK